jgi:DNA-binding NtrC family response regulator
MSEKRHAILVIDDEPFITAAVRSQLRNHFGSEIEIEVAQSAREGLFIIEELGRDSVPVVISDYRMPDIKGDELITQISNTSPNTLCILLTGQIDVEGMGNLINHAKLFRYMAKPWNQSDLILTVREALNSYNLTSMVKTQNKQIIEYAFTNTHNVRGPLASILGLISIIKHDPQTITTNGILDKLEKAAMELDTVVRSITRGLEDKT